MAIMINIYVIAEITLFVTSETKKPLNLIKNRWFFRLPPVKARNVLLSKTVMEVILNNFEFMDCS